MEEQEKKVDPVPKEEESNISMLRKNLYAQKEPEELIKRSQELFTPKQPVVQPEAIVESQPDLIDAVSGKMKRRKKIFTWIGIVGAGIIIFAVAVAGTIWYRGTQQVSASQIGIAIAAPSNFIAGGNVTYQVTVTNNSHVDWGTVNVVLTPSSGFIYQSSNPSAQVSIKNMVVSLPALSAGKSEVFETTGQLLGDEGSTADVTADVTVSPAKFPKESIKNAASASTVLSAIPLDVSVEAAKDAAVGQRVSAIIHIRNLGDATIDNAVLKLTPDPGMELAPEDSGFSPNFSVLDSFWRLPAMKPLDQVDLYSVLYVQGNPGDQRTLGIAINKMQQGQTYTLRQITHVITVSAAQVAITQSFNGSTGSSQVVSGSQNVDGVVNYKNSGTTGLTDAIIKVHFEGTGLDASTLKLHSGAFDPTSNTITWTAASLPALQRILPGQGGQITYSFAILPYNQFPLQGNTNQVLVATASLDSPDLPTPTGQTRQIISDRFTMPIQTGVLLSTDAFYDDGRLGIRSSGPLPPQVGQQTTYTVRVKVGSTLNDVQNNKVTIILPDGVSYTNSIYKTSGAVDYNQRTNTIVWTLDPLKALTGRSLPLEEFDMQVAITPGADKRGQEVLLVQSVSSAGKDAFTNNQVTSKVTDMPTTRTASPQNGDVQ